MDNSDVSEIPDPNEFSENSGFLPAQTHQNPAFLEVLAHKNVGISRQQSVDPDTISTFSKLLNAWTYGKAFKTQKAYMKLGADLFEYLAKPIEKIKEEDLTNFLELKSWLAPDSQKQRVAILKSLFKFARRKKFIVLDPAEDIPSIKTNDKINERYLSEEEVFRMIDRAQNFRNRTVLKVLYGAGLRISELNNLNWEHVLEREERMGQITVIGKGDKQRSILLTAGVFQDLVKLRSENFRYLDPVFVSREQTRLSVRMIELIVEQARLVAGIERKVSPHWFRHAHASHALDRGCPIHLLKETLGHVDISTTGNYLRARPNESSGKYLGL